MQLFLSDFFASVFVLGYPFFKKQKITKEIGKSTHVLIKNISGNLEGLAAMAMVPIYTWNMKARLRKLSPSGIPFNSELMMKRKKDFTKYHPSCQPLSREFHCRHIIRIIFFSTCLAVYLLGSAGCGTLVPWKAS